MARARTVLGDCVYGLFAWQMITGVALLLTTRQHSGQPALEAKIGATAEASP